MRLCGWPLPTTARAGLREAKGSAPLILQVSIKEAMRPQSATIRSFCSSAQGPFDIAAG